MAQIHSSVSQDDSDGLNITTPQGPVIGKLYMSNVREFLGIPYASVARWEPPRPSVSRNSTFNATQFGDSCIPNLPGGTDPEIPTSEECLNLNIWAPTLNRTQNTAVMIWVTGGGFQFGSSNDPYTQGRFLVNNNEDVLMVSFNYRTNIFGFPNAPQLVNQNQSQNLGALDIDTAIQWVFDNIAPFGGDPNRITIFGHSAGAALVTAFTFAHQNDTRVKGVIQQSGSLVGLPPGLTAFGGPFNPTAWNKAANAAGCGTNADKEQLECMKEKSADELETALRNITFPTFLPIQDGITFFADLNSRSISGEFLQVPLLVGNTEGEADLDIPPWLWFAPVISMITDFITKAVFSCPAGTTAADHVKAELPTFRYRYDGVFPDTFNRPYALTAFHSAEIPIVFGTASLSELPPTMIENELSAFVQSAWVAFARNPSQGLTELGWPQYDAETDTLAILGNSTLNATGISFTSGDLYDSNCEDVVNVFSWIIRLIHGLLGFFNFIFQ